MAIAFDVAVIGAGAAGMMAASVAGQRGRSVVLIDHAKKLGEKIRISGGGRCNFTNTGTTPQNFISQNPNFCRSALAAYTPSDFLGLVQSYGIRWHEKHKGQLFCDDSSESIIQLLRQECLKGGVTWRMPCSVQGIQKTESGYMLATDQGAINCQQLVIATGGMALPQVGATDFALRVARQFGLKVIEPRPALVPLTFDGQFWKEFVSLSGVSAEVELAVALKPKKKMVFLEDLLFTHRGLSGPGILQISSYWNPEQTLHINFAPDLDLHSRLLEAKRGSKQQLGNYLSTLLPKRLVEPWLRATGVELAVLDKRLADLPDKVLLQIATALHDWQLVPTGTAGYKKAEVMRGGVDTKDLNQKTMASRAHPTLYFIGESVDVTGWLGGYNFQWAWASGVACGRAL